MTHNYIHFIPQFPLLPIRVGLLHKHLPPEGLGHSFQRFVLPVQKVDLVVQAGKNTGNGPLFGERGEEEYSIVFK